MKKIITLTLILSAGLLFASPALAVNQVENVVTYNSNIYTNKVTASWDAVTGATKYKVKIYNRINGKYRAGKTVSTNYATFESGIKANRKYKLKVRAVDSYGVKGQWSTYKKIQTKTKRNYHNKKYDFSVQLKKGWKNFRINKQVNYDGGEEINFKLYSSEMAMWYTMFTLSIVDYDEYIANPGSYYGEVLDYNSDYVFLYYHAQDTASDLAERAQELDDITATFVLDLY